MDSLSRARQGSGCHRGVSVIVCSHPRALEVTNLSLPAATILDGAVRENLSNDFGLALANELPALGSASRGLRVLSELWNTSKTELTLEVSGRAGSRYELNVWNPGQITSVEGAVLTKLGKLEIQMPQGAADSYLQQTIAIHFGRS